MKKITCERFDLKNLFGGFTDSNNCGNMKNERVGNIYITSFKCSE